MPIFCHAHARPVRAALALISLAALAGCAGTPPEEPNPSRGEALMDPREAGRAFANICADNLPDFAGTPRAVARYPMVRDTNNGWYIHQEAQLAALVQDGECILALPANADVDQVLLSFDAGLFDEGYTGLNFVYEVEDHPRTGLSNYAFILGPQ